jgi:DNA polymerase elongation subunit (family B)
MSKNIINEDVIERFLNGADDEKYIVSLEYDYASNNIFKVIQDPVRGKLIKTDTFTPFLWCSSLTSLNFYNKDKDLQLKAMLKHGIEIVKLKTGGHARLENGLKYLVKTNKRFNNLINFFKDAGIDIYGEKHRKHFICLKPVEQYLIQKKKRLFKGIDDYNDVHRFCYDIETTGLNPELNNIILIGAKDNKGFKKTYEAFGEDGEKNALINFFSDLIKIKPTIFAGYNSADFDLPFMFKRAEILGIDVNSLVSVYNDTKLKVQEKSLKLGGETQPYNQYMIWGLNVVDISHSVRRAKAINSDIKGWSLKYITKYIEKEKPNRVYVEGNSISKIYLENKDYFINPKTGNYRLVGSIGAPEDLQEKYPNKYERVGGKQIVEQYLDDDLYETLVVDDSFSQSTFLLSKYIPTTYERVATMGTASLWRMLMLAWSYENGLAIPENDKKRNIVGGLSRLLKVGYAKNIVKFDFSSLYPSIQLVYDVFPDCDITGVMKSLLKYFRNIRIKYKYLAGDLKEKGDYEKSEYFDRKQLPIKIFINAFFGSLSAPMVFPWADLDMGETTTCVGRQSLRMMNMFFIDRGFVPLVMDSVEYDTPVYLLDYKGNIVIKAISDLFDENSDEMSPDKLRDFSEKDYQILTKNGWKNINYVYRHGTNKPIHKLVTKDRLVCVTSDHSVFQNGEQIKPSELKRGDKIDIVDLPNNTINNKVTFEFIDDFIENKLFNDINEFPIELLNCGFEETKYFIDKVSLFEAQIIGLNSKTLLASYVYLKNKVGYEFKFDENWNFNNKVNTNEIMTNIHQYVYDISTEDGTFVGGIGGVLLKNTDGVNFEAPEGVENHSYVGKGLNSLVKEGKVYTGISAHVAEFNDIFMRGEMGLDTDYEAPSCINISRKNYVIKKPNGKMKLTGNTIKSDKIQKYIIEFFDKGLPMLLDGNGYDFIELYYDYVEMIQNKKIPLLKLANKSRVKMTIDQYVNVHLKSVNKNGQTKARQAHMELLVREKANVSLGESIYYINNGKSKSTGDVKVDPKKGLIINCYRIDADELMKNPDLLGEYNVAKYLDVFNKKVEPLLVVFKPEIRKDILIKKIDGERKIFTKLECELCNGIPLKEGQQDSLDEVMTLSEMEVEFWNKVDRDPFFMYIDDSIKDVSEYWVEKNRKVLKGNEDSITSNEFEIIGLSDDETDNILHAVVS